MSYHTAKSTQYAAAQAPQSGTHKGCLQQERDIQLVKQYDVDAVFMPKSLYAGGIFAEASA